MTHQAGGRARRCRSVWERDALEQVENARSSGPPPPPHLGVHRSTKESGRGERRRLREWVKSARRVRGEGGEASARRGRREDESQSCRGPSRRRGGGVHQGVHDPSKVKPPKRVGPSEETGNEERGRRLQVKRAGPESSHRRYPRFSRSELRVRFAPRKVAGCGSQCVCGSKRQSTDRQLTNRFLEFLCTVVSFCRL